jgi:beta-alanine--pyruvate transaminase
VASAAGLATRDIFEEEGLVERAAAMSPKFLEGLFELKDLPVVTDIRGYGLFGTLDIAPLERPGLRGARLTQELFEAGLIIKMTSDALLVSPPFICEDQHLDELFTKIRDVLKTH